MENTLRTCFRIFENSESPLVCIKTDGVILYCNSAASSYFGHSQNELTGIPIPDMNCGLSFCRTPVFFRRLREKKVLRFRTFRPEENQMPVRVTSFYINSEGEEYSVLYFCGGETADPDGGACTLCRRSDSMNTDTLLENVHEKNMYDLRLIIDAIAHNWRQPLNALGLMMQDVSCTHRTGEISEKYLEDFEESGMKIILSMSEIIDSYSSLFQGGGAPVRFNFVQAIREVLKLMDIKLNFLNVGHSVICEKELNNEFCRSHDTGRSCVCRAAEITGHENEFKQVMLNLLGGLIEAAEENGAGSIRISYSINEQSIYIRLSDSSDGSKGGRNGVGFLISKAIVEKCFHGSINVTESPSETVFQMTIPNSAEMSAITF